MTQTECSEILAQLERWYAGENGRYLLQQTRQSVQDLLDTTFGYHILQMGVRTADPLCELSPIRHRMYCAPAGADAVDLCALPEELPLDCDSVDTIIAHHCLEFAQRPHEVLREIQRVLTPQGHLILIGFNPWSLYGLAGRTRGALRHPLWSAYRPLSEGRLRDWLYLLGCEVRQAHSLYAVPPAGGQRLRAALERCDGWVNRRKLPVGGLYVLHAVKQVAARPRPRKLLRNPRESLIGLVPKPSPAPTPIAPAPTPITPAARHGNTPPNGNDNA